MLSCMKSTCYSVPGQEIDVYLLREMNRYIVSIPTWGFSCRIHKDELSELPLYFLKEVINSEEHVRLASIDQAKDLAEEIQQHIRLLVFS